MSGPLLGLRSVKEVANVALKAAIGRNRRRTVVLARSVVLCIVIRVETEEPYSAIGDGEDQRVPSWARREGVARLHPVLGRQVGDAVAPAGRGYLQPHTSPANRDPTIGLRRRSCILERSRDEGTRAPLRDRVHRVGRPRWIGGAGGSGGHDREGDDAVENPHGR